MLPSARRTLRDTLFVWRIEPLPARRPDVAPPVCSPRRQRTGSRDWSRVLAYCASWCPITKVILRLRVSKNHPSPATLPQRAERYSAPVGLYQFILKAQSPDRLTLLASPTGHCSQAVPRVHVHLHFSPCAPPCTARPHPTSMQPLLSPEHSCLDCTLHARSSARPWGRWPPRWVTCGTQGPRCAR